MQFLEQPHDRDRIGRRNQCTESETHEQTLMQPNQIEDESRPTTTTDSNTPIVDRAAIVQR